VIHGIDSILLPPPNAASLISFLPSEFSTLELGLLKTGLYESINDTSNHLGGTIFAPSNFAFKVNLQVPLHKFISNIRRQKLGPRINGFLFSKYGEKYLKALLMYHVVANETLYSDAFYKGAEAGERDIPKGLFHVSPKPFSIYALLMWL
jgi:uncharacterized surface protein with fasciclin (FAS1) repeats